MNLPDFLVIIAIILFFTFAADRRLDKIEAEQAVILKHLIEELAR